MSTPAPIAPLTGKSGNPLDIAEVRLLRTYDTARLLADLEAVKSFKMVSQPGPYHRGEWKGISLHSASGDIDWAGTRRSILESFKPTAALAVAPYFAKILEEFEWKQSVRVLALPPGGKIGEHVDDMKFERGTIRVHIPLLTHPDVIFMLGGERRRWSAGELWYADFTLPHSVENHGPMVRYHLVIDTGVTETVMQMFPKAIVEQLRRAKRLPAIASKKELDTEHLAHYECQFIMPPIPSIPELRAGLSGAIRVLEGQLRVLVQGRPVFCLIPIGEHQFYIDAFGPETVLSCSMSDERVQSIEIVQSRFGGQTASAHLTVAPLLR